MGFAAVLTISFPALQVAITQAGAFGFYAGLNIVAFVLIILFLPETKQRTLEELDQIFSVPHKVFIRYQTTQAIPYFFKRWVFRQRPAPIPPLISEQDDNDLTQKYDDEKH